MSNDMIIGMYIGGVFLSLFYLALEWETGDINKIKGRFLLAFAWPLVIILATIGRIIHQDKTN